MDSNIKNRWVEAVNAFGNDINAKVVCPVCQTGYLLIFDNYFSDSDHMRFERKMVCNKCGALNYSLHSGIKNNL